ncbi:type VI secretion system tube protein Hcp [Citrobacter cronae]|uniref:type VI secretion system tube protein TssD n=1 Tax=Citrobacter cronae TaxID=1748967 RepID=UPI0021CE73A1|nr:type VI secretion system tube protein TssD [Citrobacter cronae]MCU6198459.1 type VI secretion system tube protein Hcp [Citrobacter cronae]
MSHPAHLFLIDQNGSPIIGGSEVIGREGSIEVLQLSHGMNVPHDGNTGRLTSGRKHSPMGILKEIDQSSPYLCRALCENHKLQKATIKWYRTNAAGQEEEFYHMILENVKIVGLHPSLPHINLNSVNAQNPTESLSLMYEKKTWKYLNGNIQFTDAWTYGWWG